MNIKRTQLKHDFLKSYFHNQQFDIVEALPSDASFRKYDRIISNDSSIILMDSPPEHYKLEDFICMADFLTNNHFSAPQIYHANTEDGFLLLEDFGDMNVSKYLLKYADHNTKVKTYRLIIDLLVKLQNITPLPQLSSYTTDILLCELKVYTDWYIPFATGKALHPDQKTEFLELWRDVLQIALSAGCTVLRDYHVENMMFLDRPLINSIGLLDFQDAVIGSPFYDVVSVLEDARFELDTSFTDECLDYYLSQNSHLNKKDSYLIYHILGAQRNSRILGVFARKALRDNQKSYLQYIPRVLRYLEHDLSHGHLQQVAVWIKKNLKSTQ